MSAEETVVQSEEFSTDANRVESLGSTSQNAGSAIDESATHPAPSLFAGGWGGLWNTVKKDMSEFVTVIAADTRKWANTAATLGTASDDSPVHADSENNRGTDHASTVVNEVPSASTASSALAEPSEISAADQPRLAAAVDDAKAKLAQLEAEGDDVEW